MDERVRLAGVKHDRKITKETDGQFLFEYQRAILLTLKDDGALNDAQYRYGEEKLRNQLRKYLTQDRAEERSGTP